MVVSLGLGAVYVAGTLRAAASLGYAGLVSPRMVAFFFLFLILAMFIYGSIYLPWARRARSSKGAEPPDAGRPRSSFRRSSVPCHPRVTDERPSARPFPTATPFLMLLRVGLHPAPPVWQVALSVALTLTAAVACVWAAGRVFRVGLLAQGKAPSLFELARWVFSGR